MNYAKEMRAQKKRSDKCAKDAIITAQLGCKKIALTRNGQKKQTCMKCTQVTGVTKGYWPERPPPRRLREDADIREASQTDKRMQVCESEFEEDATSCDQ